jgi:hypothetical protein
MRYFKKTIVALIIAAVIPAILPLCALADIDNQKSVTPVPPEILTTPQEKIPVEQVKKPISKWWYASAAVLLLIPALGSGGGDDDDDDDTGSIVISSPAP